jgi:hypothetical protein
VRDPHTSRQPARLLHVVVPKGHVIVFRGDLVHAGDEYRRASNLRFHFHLDVLTRTGPLRAQDAVGAVRTLSASASATYSFARAPILVRAEALGVSA